MIFKATTNSWNNDCWESGHLKSNLKWTFHKGIFNPNRYCFSSKLWNFNQSQSFPIIVYLFY